MEPIQNPRLMDEIPREPTGCAGRITTEEQDPRQCCTAAYRGSVSGFAWLFDRTKARSVRASNCAVNPATTARNFLKHTNIAREAKINVTRQHAATHKAIVDAMRTSFE